MRSADFSERFPLTSAVVQQGMEQGLHHGAQVYISQSGAILADDGLGMSAPDVPMTAETVNPWLSAAKPLTAVLIAELVEAGQLHWDDPVARHIPEFGTRGKSAVTIRHLLTHTAGLNRVDPGWPEVEWKESLRRIRAAEADPQWIIGETAGYDPWCAWFLLGEIIQRVTETPFPDVFEERLLTPLNMNNTWATLTPEAWAQRRNRLGRMWERQRGTLAPLDWNDTARCTRPSPGSSVRGPIRELGRFYEMLRAGGVGANGPILSSDAVAAMTTRQRIGKFDYTFGQVVDWGLGFIIDSNQYGADTITYGYGRFSSPRTFGHGGSQSSQGYCDPERELVVAYVFNGRPGEGQHQRRARAFNEAVYQDLQRNGRISLGV